MHETLLDSIKAYIDSIEIKESTILIHGWIFNDYTKNQVGIRINDGCRQVIVIQKRIDVNDFYHLREDINVGFECEYQFQSLDDIFLEILNENQMWKKCLKINCIPFLPTIHAHPVISFLVVDDFYEFPDQVREFALSQRFLEHKEYHKGKRTEETFRFPGLKEKFEILLGKKIINWEHYGTNGCFQYCIAGDQLVYHVDTQTYAGLIYLSKDAPPHTGTSFFRSKHTKKMKPYDDFQIVFGKGFYDSTQFELVDTVGNVYNRLVLFDAQLIHAASCYFGNEKENGRLFQLFFFDLE